MSETRAGILPGHWLHLLLCLLAVGFVYIYRIGDKAMDFDERYSINIATGMGGHNTEYSRFGKFVATPIPGPVFSSAQYWQRYKLSNTVSTAMNDNGQGLPYFFLLHIWLKAVGISGYCARLPSALLILTSLSAFYALLRRWQLNHVFALLTTCLLGLNGVVIGMAQYARFYSLGILLTVLSCYMVWSMYKSAPGRKKGLLLGLLWGIMLLNQFFSVFIVFAQGIFLLRRHWHLRPVKPVLAVAGGLAVPFIIWLVPLHGWESLRNIYALHSGERLVVETMITSATPLNTAVALCCGLAASAGQPISMLQTQTLFAPLMLMLPAWTLIGMAVLQRRRHHGANTVGLCLMALGIYTVASLAHAFLTGYNLLFQPRYWVLVYPLSYTLLGWALLSLWKQQSGFRWLAILVSIVTSARVCYTSAAAVSGLSITTKGFAPSHVQRFEDYEGAAQAIKASAQTGDTVSYQNWPVAQTINWYLKDAPQLVQQVDTAQQELAVIKNGNKQRAVPIARGRAKAAKPLWKF